MTPPAVTLTASIFIADDHKIIRDGLRVLLERNGGFQIAGDANNGRALLEQVLQLRPAIVVTDMAMSELNGIEATRLLRERGYAGIIVMLSMHDERRIISQAQAAGVNAYVHKDYAFEEILAAIDSAQRGGFWLSPELSGLSQDGRVRVLSEILSPREREVMQLFAEGHGTKEVASKLLISSKTIETHRRNIFSKLNVNNVVDLTRIAIREGMVQA